MDRNLRAFISVAEMASLTAAADKIGITQPSITKRLNNLETELGSRLFTRHHRGIVLTDAGERFYKRAKRIEQEYLQAAEELKSLTSAGLPVLRIGAGPLFHLRYVSRIFGMMHSEFNALKFVLNAGINEMTIPMLLAGELDLVLGVIDYSGDELGLRTQALTTVEQGVVMRRTSSALQDDGRLPASELHKRPWILYGADRKNEDWLKRYFARNSLSSPTIVLRTSAFSAGLQLVESDQFVMMAPLQLAPVIESAGLVIHPVSPALNRQPAGIYVRESSMEFHAVQRFIELLQREFAELPEGSNGQSSY